MAKIPLLECLTRQSYRESLEKSSSPHPRTDEEDENGDEEVGETSTQSAILCPADSQKNRKSPSPVSASGEASSQASSSPQDRLKSNCNLKAALEEEEESPERGATPSFNVTLLDWINVQDRPNDVESVVRKCFDSINRVSNRRVIMGGNVLVKNMNQFVNLWQPLYCLEVTSSGHYGILCQCRGVSLLLYYLYQITYIYAAVSKQEHLKLLIYNLKSVM